MHWRKTRTLCGAAPHVLVFLQCSLVHECNVVWFLTVYRSSNLDLLGTGKLLPGETGVMEFVLNPAGVGLKTISVLILGLRN